MNFKTIKLLLLSGLLIFIGFYITQPEEKLENPQPEHHSTSLQKIDELTQEKIVITYLKENQKLPTYYITKKEAQKSGWIASKGNLCEVLPGKAIGGDFFGNREGKLPKQIGRKYYEADINYNCGRRGSERLVYSDDGLIFITKDHYKTFQKQ